MADDPFFGPATIDRDEWRDAPARHRYVHGSFDGTDTRFVVCLPDPASYEGRVIQFLQGGMGGNEHQGVLLNGPQIAFENGAAYVESNQGHIGNDLSGIRGDMSILAWRASAQTARFARSLAAETYGTAPHHSYVFGGSGGGMRTIDCITNCPDLWDGAVPFIINRNGLMSYNWSILSWAVAVLGDRVGDVVDATDAGGSGDPFSVLDDDAQRDALAALYRAGFCRGAESQIEPNPLSVLGLQLIQRADPTYFEDFWKVPGYAGADGSLVIDRMLAAGEATVRQVLTPADLLALGAAGDDLNAGVLGRAPAGSIFGVVLEGVERPNLLHGATLDVIDGAAAGRRLQITGLIGEAVTAILDPVGFQGVEPGDRVAFDNRDMVAFAYFHRHLVSDRYPAMRQFVIDGQPIHPQRPLTIEALPVPSGRFDGKMILIQHAADRECWPNCAEPFVSDVRAHLGAATDDRFRVWWSEHAAHLVPLTPAGRTRYLSYGGSYAQAVRDVVAWVEDDVAPPPSTQYCLEDTGRLVLPTTAQDRGGIQPVVRATANGAPRAEVRVGEPVQLEGVATVPPGAGAIVALDWDLAGTGAWEHRDPDVDGTSAEAQSVLTHSYDTVGTRLATLRATSHRDGAGGTSLREVTNLARVRIVVRA